MPSPATMRRIIPWWILHNQNSRAALLVLVVTTTRTAVLPCLHPCLALESPPSSTALIYLAWQTCCRVFFIINITELNTRMVR